MRILAALILAIAPLVASSQPMGTVSTVAGGSLTGDGGAAIYASVEARGIAATSDGGFVFADSLSNQIRKVRSDGTIVTVAGNGTRSYSGDGGPALSAALSSPTSVAFDDAGALYVFDSGNFRIRRIRMDGVIETFAGTGSEGFGGDGGAPLGAQFGAEGYLAAGAGGVVWISDTRNGRVRRITGGLITTVAGSGATSGPEEDGVSAISARLVSPMGLVGDGSGGFYVAAGRLVRHVNAAGFISTVAGTTSASGVFYPGNVGPATSIGLLGPTHVARDAAGNLYVNEVGGYRIVRIDTAGNLSTFAGTRIYGASGDGGPATSAQVVAWNLAMSPAGDVYFYNAPLRIRRVDPAGIITTVAGTGSPTYTGDGGPASLAYLSSPSMVAAMSDGALYVKAVFGVRRVAEDRTIRTEGKLADSWGFAADHLGNLYFAEPGFHRVSKLAPDGSVTRVAGTGEPGFFGDGGAASAARLTAPLRLAADGEGNLYISEQGNPTGQPPVGARLRKVNSAGIITTIAGDGTLGVGADGALAVSSAINAGPIAIARDGSVLVVDGAGHRVRRVDQQGRLRAFAGTGVMGTGGDGGDATQATLTGPTDIAVDPSGNAYIVHAGSVVRRVNWHDGRVERVAGTGVASWGGEDVAALPSPLWSPTNLATDSSRYLYVTEAGPVLGSYSNGRVRRIVVGDLFPEAFSFGSVSGAAVGSVQTSTATPSGYEASTVVTIANGEFSPGCTGTYTDLPLSLAPGQPVCVRHTAALEANDIAVMTLTVGGRVATYTSTTAVAPGSLTLSPSTLDFGTQLTNTGSPPQVATLTNSGVTSAKVHAVTAPASIVVTHDCAVLAPGASCSLAIVFKPTAGGPVSGSIGIRATVGSYDLPASGVGDRSLASHYYRSILRREPEPAGVTYWNAEAARIEAGGANVSEVWFALAMSFFNSAEYRAFNRDTTGYLTDLYRTFFDRGPDASGIAYWSGLIGQGLPREIILVSFMLSPEFALRTAMVFGVKPSRPEVDIAVDFYRGLLGRLPDDRGLAFWIARFRAAQCQGASNVYYAAQEISSAFIGTEYAARNRTNAEYVTDLYNAFLRRGGELEGVKFWINRLDDGTFTREYARSQFGQLPEFQARAGRISAACGR